MRAWPVARSIFDAPLCEGSERAGNRLDKAVVADKLSPFHFPGAHGRFTFYCQRFARVAPAPRFKESWTMDARRPSRCSRTRLFTFSHLWRPREGLWFMVRAYSDHQPWTRAFRAGGHGTEWLKSLFSCARKHV